MATSDLARRLSHESGDGRRLELIQAIPHLSVTLDREFLTGPDQEAESA